MTPTLPQPIAACFAATNTHDIDVMLQPFADGAIVRDEGRELDQQKRRGYSRPKSVLLRHLRHSHLL
jgi:hypothetical protein